MAETRRCDVSLWECRVKVRTFDKSIALLEGGLFEPSESIGTIRIESSNRKRLVRPKTVCFIIAKLYI